MEANGCTYISLMGCLIISIFFLKWFLKIDATTCSCIQVNERSLHLGPIHWPWVWQEALMDSQTSIKVSWGTLGHRSPSTDNYCVIAWSLCILKHITQATQFNDGYGWSSIFITQKTSWKSKVKTLYARMQIDNMGQVTKLWLSCYLVLLSIDSKTR